MRDWYVGAGGQTGAGEGAGGSTSIAAFVRKVAFGRCSVRVGYCVSLLFVAMDCGDRIVRAYRGVNEDVAIDGDCEWLLSSGGRDFGEVLRTHRLLRFASFCIVKCSTGIVRVCGGVNEDVAIEYSL